MVQVEAYATWLSGVALSVMYYRMRVRT